MVRGSSKIHREYRSGGLGEGGGGMCKGREEEGFSREFCRFADYYLRAVRCSNSLKIST